MRVSRLMLVTLRDVPADAEIASHQLLIRGGYIRRVTTGVYAYMPLMWRVLSKIISIVQEEMDSVGCLQTLLPQIHPAELWKRSGRWEGYTAGEGIMFHLKDRQGRELGLGPTHEEVITNIAKEMIHSYKQLPISLYQIQTKFRDEIRPRFGLMRSREFIMKDAYSFHANQKDLQETYQRMDNAYVQIFSRCGIETVAVDADSGAIGGAASQEFMAKADAGEDLILTSSDKKYSANQEKAISIAPIAIPLEKGKSILIETPNQRSIEEICSHQNIEPSQTIKVLLLLSITADKEFQPLIISIRGDQELNEIKLINVLTNKIDKQILSIEIINQELLKKQGLQDFPFGYIGPDLDDSFLSKAKSWKKKFIRLADFTAADLESFVCGANKVNYHRKFFNWSLLGGVPETHDLRKAKAGDRCLHDSNQKLEEHRGIEIGHIFQLGQKYSEALEANFTNTAGQQEHFLMGCYGIGISRLAQAAVEQNHDQSGICWPISIAPFEVIIVVANVQNHIQLELGEKIYQELTKTHIDVVIDDRSERAGVKFKDADLIGIPWRIVVGREAENGQVELINRSNKETQILQTSEALEKLLAEIPN